jgi:hypothetical protein
LEASADLWPRSGVPVRARRTGNQAEIKQLNNEEEELRETCRALLRREIIEPIADSYRILVPLIAYYVRSQHQPI